MKGYYHLFTKISLVCVCLIIIAGAVVRMTGSGMGCPDWPKCFGYYIPPTDAKDIVFQPNHDYQEGQVIQVEDMFYYAKEDFTSAENLSLSNWEKNTKHDYNTFNVTHTWIEFVNRLFTAVAGIPILILFIIGLRLSRKEWALKLAAFLVILGMGFAAWLGKTVVDSNLLPLKITIHMAVAFFIVGALVYAVYKSELKFNTFSVSKTFKYVAIGTLLLTLLQVFLGTQVRQFVDEQIDLVGYQQELWMQQPEIQFYIHRTFSVLVLLTNAWLIYEALKKKYNIPTLRYILIVIGLEIASGMLMYYLDFPFTTQPIHLVLSAILFGLQFYLILKLCYPKKQLETL